MKKIFKNSKTLEILAIFILSLTPLLWLKAGEIILGHDSGFRVNPIEHLKNLFYSWNEISNFGIDWTLFKGFLITQFPEALFTFLTGSLTLGQTLTFVFWFFAMGISMYIFVKSFFPQKRFWIARIFSSSFYMFNFFVLQGWFIAERAKFSLFAVLPIEILILYKTLNRDFSPLKGTILFSLVFFIFNGGGALPFYGSIALSFLATFLFLTVIHTIQKGLREIWYSLFVSVCFIVGFLIVNAYWILPQIQFFLSRYQATLSSVGGIGGVISWEEMVNQFANFANLFRLQGIPDWYNNLHPYSNYFLENPILIIASYVPFLLIVFGLLFYKDIEKEDRNDNLVILIFLIFLTGIIFTAGSKEFTGFIYILLVRFVPGFVIFRSGFYKFGPLFWFAFIFLTGYYLNVLINKFSYRRAYHTIAGLLGLCFVLVYHFPYFSVNFFDWNKPFTTKVTIPTYVKEMSDFINEKANPNTRILILPGVDPQFRVDSYEWGYFSLDLLPRLTIKRPVVADDNESLALISLIYSALEEGKKDTFLRLLETSGIDRILWRDDVLMADKKKKSEDFALLEENLLEIPGIALEHQSGKWKLYRLQNDSEWKPIRVFNKMVYSNSDTASLSDLILLEPELVDPVAFSRGLGAKNLQNITPFIEKEYIELNCLFCKPGELEKIGDIPSVQILPDSLFYFLVSYREKKVFEKYKNSPEERIDVDLAFAGKRLRELSQLLKRKGDQKSDALILGLLIKYKERINDSLEQTEKLSPLRKDFRKIWILTYLKNQKKFLLELNAEKILVGDHFVDLAVFVNNSISDLGTEVWLTDSLEEKKFIFENGKTGTYEFLILSENDSPESIYLESKNLVSGQTVELQAGVHRLTLLYPRQKNLLTEDFSPITSELKLEPGEKEVFGVQNVNSQSSYLISFDYEVIEGISYEFSIFEGDEKVVRKELTGNKGPQFFNFFFTPSLGLSEFSIVFSTRGITEENLTTIKNFRAAKFFEPKVFLKEESDVENRPLPTISFVKINPTLYKVRVEKAESPYILSFSQRFDPGWKLFSAGTFPLRPIKEDYHFSVDGYKNSWVVGKPGSYEIYLLYYPQLFFYIGGGISLLGLFTFLVASLRLKNKEYGKSI